MPDDELFKRYLEIGASILGMSRERAESIVKDLVASGEVARNQATKAADWLVERGRAGTEELSEMVRREIRQQVTTLGLATKDDVARLEAQIEALKASAATVPPPVAPPGTRRKAAAPAKAARSKKAPATKSATASKPAGISRSGSVRKRPPPAGGTAPPEG